MFFFSSQLKTSNGKSSICLCCQKSVGDSHPWQCDLDIMDAHDVDALQDGSGQHGGVTHPKAQGCRWPARLTRRYQAGIHRERPCLRDQWRPASAPARLQSFASHDGLHKRLSRRTKHYGQAETPQAVKPRHNLEILATRLTKAQTGVNDEL